MRRFLIPLGLALSVLSMLAAATAACAEERRFKGSGSGALNAFTARLNAGGHSTHLGKSSVQFFADQSALDSGDIRLHFCGFIAANGDGLAAAIESSSFDPETGVLAATILFLPIGSGRFADAVGSARLLILFDDWTDPFGNPSFDFAVEGTIDY